MLGLGGLGFTGLYFVARFAVRDQFDIALQARAVAISSSTIWDATGLKITFDERNLPSLDDDDPTPDFYELIPLGQGSPLRSISLKEADLPLGPPGAQTARRFWNLTLPNGRSGRAIAYPFSPSGPAPASNKVVLVLAVDLDDLDETYTQLIVFFVVGSVLAVGAIIWVVPQVLRRGLASLDALGRQVAQIDAGTLSVRLPSDELPSELLVISNQLNHLLSRLEQSFARERRFSADLAHEIRTPVAELRLLAECALKWPANRDGDTDRDTLAIALHLERLLTRLLDLARSEHGQVKTQIEPLDLADLIDQVWQTFVARASERALRFEFKIDGLRVEADSLLMKSILVNLFDNAIDYTATGEVVAVTLATHAVSGRAIVTLSNRPTLGLKPEEVAQLFDPFWRQEVARSDGRHTGLGLSLSRAFAQAMGWTLIAGLESDGRITLVLSGPPGELAVNKGGHSEAAPR
jgi:signal transduction histidine kinase